MRLSSIAIVVTTFAAAAGLCLVAAGFAVNVIEDNSEYSVRVALDDTEMTWAEVHANGLQVFLSGIAPSEAKRFKALSTAGTIVDAARVIDNMQVADTTRMTPPRFSIEILRNDSGISLIGLIPQATDREQVIARLSRVVGAGQVTDLLEAAEYDVPDGWDTALDFAMDALTNLPRAKVSVEAGRVAITAISDSPEAKRRLETELTRQSPASLRLALDISAPRPVITPFTLRFVMDAEGARFDACSADSEAARDKIIQSAIDAGLVGKAICTIGLGVPSPSWADAAAASIRALKDINGGTVTISDADISLIGIEGTEPTLFDRRIGELEAALPDVFALHSELPVQQDAQATGPADFVATLSPEGQVQLRGRISDELTQAAAESFAKARFGSKSVQMAARLDDTLPQDWPMRVLTGLEALSKLANGSVTVTASQVEVAGNTGNPSASDEISRLLADKLGEGELFQIRVSYQKKLDPVLGLPTPEECESEIKAILDARKINFEPGSATPMSDAVEIIDEIATILSKCGGIDMEIGGHTDSQGREEMNQQLSQDRAQAVLAALRERQVRDVNLTAVGYGETQPIATNDTEEGRETNRRIEFRLLSEAPAETPLETADQTSEEGVPLDDTVVAPEDATSEQGSGD